MLDDRIAVGGLRLVRRGCGCADGDDEDTGAEAAATAATATATATAATAAAADLVSSGVRGRGWTASALRPLLCAH